jgi:hypothetical protein
MSGNTIRGLWAQVRYPLGFGRQAWKQDDMVVQVFGCGTASNPEASTIDGCKFFNLNLSSTTSGSTQVNGIYLKMTKAGSAAAVALKIEVAGGATALELTGGISYAAPSTFTSQESHLLAMGTYTSALVIADTGTTFVAQSINLSSIGNAASAGNQVAAMRLRVDVDTANQANTAISCLQIRSDLAYNVYAATGISGSTNISANIALPTASLQGIYYQITGAGAVTCPNEPNVMEIGYHQSSGGGGFNAVARFDVNATGCSITHILRLKNYAGTVTNAISIEGAFSVGILMATGLAQALVIGTSSAPLAYAGSGTQSFLEVYTTQSGVISTARGLMVQHEYTGTNGAGTVIAYAIRGYAKVSGTLGASAQSGYAAGLQGKVEMSGTLVDGGKISAVLAQLNSSGGTFTAGQIQALWVDSQITPGQVSGMSGAAYSEYNLVKLTNAGSVRSIFCYSGTADYLFDLSVVGGLFCEPTLNVSVASGRIKLTVGGVTKYLQMYNS